MDQNKLTPIEVVERYYERHLAYKEAFDKDPFSEKQRQEEVVKLANSGLDLESKELIDKMTELMVDKSYKIADVNNAASKFMMFTDFYLLTQEEPLPEEILKAYEALPIKSSIKSHFSIKDGEFVKNEEVEVNEETKNYFKAVIKQIRAQV